ncbi:MAG TPA: hypothetical protein VIV12_01480 [Streptosporangiaceae bacterium]
MEQDRSTDEWARGFPDLVGQPDRYVLCEGRAGFDVVMGVTEDGGPGVVIRLSLPDGRAALAGFNLLGVIDSMLEAADWSGLRVVLGLAKRHQAPDPSSN